MQKQQVMQKCVNFIAFKISLPRRSVELPRKDGERTKSQRGLERTNNSTPAP